MIRWFARSSKTIDGKTVYYIDLPAGWSVVSGSANGVWASWRGAPGMHGLA